MFKQLTGEEAAMRMHQWLRSKNLLDAAHDLPWASAPSGYRAELIAVFTRSPTPPAKPVDLTRV